MSLFTSMPQIRQTSIHASPRRKVFVKLLPGSKPSGLRKAIQFAYTASIAYAHHDPLPPTDVVLTYPQIHYPIVVNRIIAAGGIFTGTNPGYTSYVLSHAVKIANVTTFIVELELLYHIQTAAKENDISDFKILVFDTGLPGQSIPPGLKSWRTLFNHGETEWVRFNDLETAENTQAARLFSSGTTGLPKAAVLSHYNFIAQEMMTSVFFPCPYTAISMIALPLFHAAVAPRTHFSPLRSGIKTYFMRRFALEPFLTNIQRFAITVVPSPVSM